MAKRKTLHGDTYKQLIDVAYDYFRDCELEGVDTDDLQEELYDAGFNINKIDNKQVTTALLNAAYKAAAHWATYYIEAMDDLNSREWANDGIEINQQNLTEVIELIRDHF